MSLKVMMDIQKKFDLNHGGSHPFYVKIDERNLEELEHLVVCLVGEVGEFSNILKKVRRGDFELHQVKSELDEELADIFIYLLKIAIQFDVDLEARFLDKVNKNNERFKKYEK